MKKIIKKYRFYPYWLFFLQDKWLLRQSERGWKLIDYGLFYYVFEEYFGEKIVFFSYDRGLGGYRRGDGKYSLSMRYPLLESQFSKKRNKSKLNNSIRKKRNKIIIEISSEKIDYSYFELIHDRDKWHLLAWLRNVGYLLFMIIMCLILTVF